MSLDPKKIKQRRLKLKLTQDEAATLAGIARPNWARIEGGVKTDTKLSTALAIAKALKCPITKLIKD